MVTRSHLLQQDSRKDGGRAYSSSSSPPFIGSGRDEYDKLKVGASLVQICSMMVYEGPGVVSRIWKELADIMLRMGTVSG